MYAIVDVVLEQRCGYHIVWLFVVTNKTISLNLCEKYNFNNGLNSALGQAAHNSYSTKD